MPGIAVEGSQYADARVLNPFPTGGLPLVFSQQILDACSLACSVKDRPDDFHSRYNMDKIAFKPTGIGRERKRPIRRHTPRVQYHIQIPEGTKAYVDGDKHQRYNNDGWIKCIDPPGSIYYVHPRERILTEANLLDLEYLMLASKCAVALKQIASEKGISLSDDDELVLQLKIAIDNISEDSKGDISEITRAYSCGYYFVSHVDRSIFWVHDYTLIIETHPGYPTPSHIGRRIESYYWEHCQLYPSHRPVSPKILNEVRALVYYGLTDQLISDQSLNPFDSDELVPILSLFSHKEDLLSSSRPQEHTVWIISRLMREFSYAHFRDYYGQPTARLDADQSVYYELNPGKLTPILKIISPFVFNAPNVYMQAFKRVSVDHLVNRIPLKKFLSKLNDELQGYTLYSTVILNANIVFLALVYVSPPATDSDPQAHPQTVPQLLSYASTVASMGGIVLGLVLSRQRSRKSTDDAVEFFNQMVSREFGILKMAYIYSMPYVCLVWSMILFATAFFSLSFRMTALATRIIVAIFGVVTLGLIIWTASVIWTDGHKRKVRENDAV